MKRIASLTSAIALAFFVGQGAWVYGQAGGGGGGGAGAGGAGAGGAAGGQAAGGAAGAGGAVGGQGAIGGQGAVGGQGAAGAGARAGAGAVGGQAGAGAQGGVQAGAGVRPAQPGAQVGAQAGVGAQGQAGINANNNFGGLRQQPWFNPRVIRQQLNLNDDQFNQLNRSYAEYWNRYNQGMSQLGRDLNQQQRMQRLRELEGNFQRDFSTSTNRVFTDPQQRERFNQLQLQYQGYAAFNDPRIQQQLNLTPQQRQRLNELNTEWNIQMGRMGSEFRTGDEGITNRMRNLQQQFNQRFNAILNDEQRQTWQGMVGEPFNFPPEVFFQTNTDAGGTQSNTNPAVTPNAGATAVPRTDNRDVTNGKSGVRAGQNNPSNPQLPR